MVLDKKRMGILDKKWRGTLNKAAPNFNCGSEKSRTEIYNMFNKKWGVSV